MRLFGLIHRLTLYPIMCINIRSIIDMFRNIKKRYRNIPEERRKNRGLKAHKKGIINKNTSTSPIAENEKSIGHMQVPIANQHLSTTLNQEKKHLLGEDADPLLITLDNIGFVGVFDGMGGAGATEYTLPDRTKHTGAYIASRLVCDSFKDFIKQNPQSNIDTPCLQKHIKEQLDKYVVDKNIKPTGLRSPIIRILPTTLSVIAYQQEYNMIDIHSYWCGDSRNYLLTKSGLMQISTDDLKSKQDPLENLRNDDALSNCICQDKEFTINKLHVANQHVPIILLSATDGCFGYLPSPMHFEQLLLETLMQSIDIEEWKNNIIETLKPISGDDFSMSIVMLGLTFEDWKVYLQPRLQYLLKTYIQPLEEMKREIEVAQNKVEDTKQLLYDKTTELWNTYKTNYLNQQ